MGIAIIIPDINFDDVNIGKVTPAKEINVKSLSIIKGTISGNNIPLLIQYSPLNATNKGVVWKSSNKTIAVVNTDGVVEVQQGAKSTPVTITAKLEADMSITASIDLEVTFTNVLKIPFNTGLVTMTNNKSEMFTCAEDLFGDSYPQWTLMLYSENIAIQGGGNQINQGERYVFYTKNVPNFKFSIYSKYDADLTTLAALGSAYFYWQDNESPSAYFHYGKRIANIAIKRDHRKFYISIDGSTWKHVTGTGGTELGDFLYTSEGFMIGGNNDSGYYFNGKIHAKLITSIDSGADSEVASFFNTYKQGS